MYVSISSNYQQPPNPPYGLLPWRQMLTVILAPDSFLGDNFYHQSWMAHYNSIKIINNHSQCHLTYDCLKYMWLFTNFLPTSGTYTVILTSIGSINYWFESPKKIKKSNICMDNNNWFESSRKEKKKKKTYV